jgi:tetratricopeptide (TPR) repeat protein
VSGELPGSYESMYRSALEAAGIGQMDKAIETALRMVNRLCRLRPETIARKPDLQDTLRKSWYTTVQFLRWAQRFPEAIDLCNLVADRLEDPDEARQLAGSLMIEQGQVDQGLAYLSEIAERRQASSYWAHLAVEQLVLRRYESAEASCRAALALAQDNSQAASANLTLFELYQRTGRVDQALSAWNMATVLNTGLGDLVSQVCDWLIRQGELEKARTYLARDTNPVTQMFYQGLLDWQSNRPQPAKDKWRRVVLMEPNDSGPELEAWLEASLRLGEPARVTEWAQKAQSAAYIQGIGELALVGIAHLMQGNAAQTHVWFEEAITRLRRRWPPQTTLPARYWALLTLLATDYEAVQNVAHCFDRGDDGA